MNMEGQAGGEDQYVDVEGSDLSDFDEPQRQNVGEKPKKLKKGDPEYNPWNLTEHIEWEKEMKDVLAWLSSPPNNRVWPEYCTDSPDLRKNKNNKTCFRRKCKKFSVAVNQPGILFRRIISISKAGRVGKSFAKVINCFNLNLAKKTFLEFVIPRRK